MTDVLEILDSDRVGRWIFSPIHYNKEKKEIEILSTFQFPSRKGSSQKVESVNCYRLIDRGTSIDFLGKQALKEKNKIRKASNKNLLEYEGCIDANVGRIRSLKSEYHYFDVLHAPENGNNAHCHIVFNFNATENKVAKKERAKEGLYNCFSELKLM